MFSFEDDSLRRGPRVSLILKLTKELNRLVRVTELVLGVLHKALYMFPHPITGYQTKDIVDLILLTKGKDFRRAIMAVSTKDDPDIGPGIPQPVDNPLQDRDNLFATRSLAWS